MQVDLDRHYDQRRRDAPCLSRGIVDTGRGPDRLQSRVELMPQTMPGCLVIDAESFLFRHTFRKDSRHTQDFVIVPEVFIDRYEARSQVAIGIRYRTVCTALQR